MGSKKSCVTLNPRGTRAFQITASTHARCFKDLLVLQRFQKKLKKLYKRIFYKFRDYSITGGFVTDFYPIYFVFCPALLYFLFISLNLLALSYFSFYVYFFYVSSV